jgi:Polysaccharide lyase
MKLTINTDFGKAGCRQTRNVEAKSGKTFVYSAWYYLPRREIPTRDMWNVFQFKSGSPSVHSIGTDPFWTINIVRSRRGGPLRLVLKWKGGDTDHTRGVRGPFADSQRHPRTYRQRRAVVPIRRWFKINAYLKQSGDFSGALVVRQDGVLLWNMRGIRTKYPDGWQSWSIGNYSNGIRNDPATIYIDNARVAKP